MTDDKTTQKMTDEEFDTYCEWVINKFFPNPPYVLAGGETISDTSNEAVYQVLTLHASLDDDTKDMDDEQLRGWVLGRVQKIRRQARTYEEAIDDFAADTPYGRAFADFAKTKLNGLDITLYGEDGQDPDYRFDRWMDSLFDEFAENLLD